MRSPIEKPIAPPCRSRSRNRLFIASLTLWTSLSLLTGCCGVQSPDRVPTSQAVLTATQSGLTRPTPDEQLKAVVVPPVGWTLQPLKSTPTSLHRVWISPTGNTAYGVISFSLPLPVGTGIVLPRFIAKMRAAEGDATLVEQHDDDRLPGLRFVAEGGLYRIRCNLQTSGFHGWAVYAGTLRNKPVDDRELQTAVDAREQTRVGLR